MSATFEVMSPATGMAVAPCPTTAWRTPAPRRRRPWRLHDLARTTAYERSAVLMAWASAIMAEEASSAG